MSELGSKVARLGVIGAGWWVTENHLPILERRDDIELVAVCRRDMAALDKIRRRFDFPEAFGDYVEMLTAVGDDLDGVVIGSPHDLHFEHARAVLQYGCHALVEKPMAMTADEAKALLDLSVASGLEVLIPHGWNFQPYTRRARGLILAGEIGVVEHVSCSMASPRRAQYSGTSRASGTLVDQDVSTYSNPARGGGYGWGQLVHALAMLFYVTELDAERVSATMLHSTSTGADLHDALCLDFANGATGSVSGSSGLPPHLGYRIKLDVFGSEGVLGLDLEHGMLELRREDGNDSTFEFEYGGSYDCLAPVEAFADICVGKSTRNDAPAHVGLKSVRVLEDAYVSVRESNHSRY